MTEKGDREFAKALLGTYKRWNLPLHKIEVDETLHPKYLTDKEIELYKQIKVLSTRAYWILFMISHRRKDLERGRKYTLRTGKEWPDPEDPLNAPKPGYTGNY